MLSLSVLCLAVGCPAPHVSKSIDVECHALVLSLPTRFVVVTLNEREPADGMVHSEWKTSSGEELSVLVWPDGPRVDIDRGPMIVASQEPFSMAGVATRLVRTEVFFGVEDEVLVVHFAIGKAAYVVYARSMSRRDFVSILETARLAPR